MSTPVADRVAYECDRLKGELLNHITEYRAAKRRFSDRTAYFRRRHGDVLGEIQAQDDYQRKAAMADCGWYAQEIQVAAAALTALNTTRED